MSFHDSHYGNSHIVCSYKVYSAKFSWLNYFNSSIFIYQFLRLIGWSLKPSIDEVLVTSHSTFTDWIGGWAWNRSEVAEFHTMPSAVIDRAIGWPDGIIPRSHCEALYHFAKYINVSQSSKQSIMTSNGIC